MAETQSPQMPAKSKRDILGERLKKKYPDKDYSNDEELFGQINDDYDDYDNQINQYKDREGRLTDMFSKDPRSAQFIADMAKGKDPWIAVIERLGIDGVTELINDPEKQTQYAEANKKYIERLAKEKTLDEEYKKNLSESMDLLEKIQKQQQIPDEVMDSAMELMTRTCNEVLMGKFTEETVNMALNSVNYTADMENARAEGMVAGRNAKIDEKLKTPRQGDGMPNLAGSNNAPTRKTANRSMFDLADEAR